MTMIETERLILRRPILEDFDLWAEMMAHEDAARFLGGAQPKAAVWRTLMTVRGAWELTGVSMFAVVEKASGKWVGRGGPWQPHEWPGTEVGWGLHPDSWGKGYALEAAVAAMNYAFDTLGWTEVVHAIDPAHERSPALARRLGSTNRGPGRLPAPFATSPVDIWGQTRDAWRARR